MNLQSIQTGKAQRYGDPTKSKFAEKEWESGIFKSTISEPAVVTKTGIIGDEQADLKVHGGPDKAICVYSLDHLPYWEKQINKELAAGAFGENFSVTDVSESDVCIGDTFRCGDVTVQVSQPRQPCWKLARRWGAKEIITLMQDNGKTGWYFRVLEEGNILAPADIELIDRPYADWTITRANEVMYRDTKNIDAAHTLSQIKELATSWQEVLQKRVSRI